jgi:Do/DeqQ family serine protease
MKRIILATAAIYLLASAACTSSTAQVPSGYISQEDFTNAAEQTVNGVVSVKSYATPQQQSVQSFGNSDFFNDPFFEYFFGSPQQRRSTPRESEPKKQEPRQIGLGSGVIISEDGYIVTNNHVIANAEKLEVTLNDNRNYEATVIGADATTDLALIKIDAPDLHVIPIGNSEDLKVGEWVLAVGNPFGFTSSVTAGIVSAKARNISTTTRSQSTGGIESYIQTDAAVNQGNSGGALVNLKGELVGINTAIYSQTGAYAGCSFAIPTSIVQKVVDDLRKFGTVQRAYLGISFRELDPDFITEKGIKGITSGIYVASVEDRSAAHEAGLKEGDIIVAINDTPTRQTAELQEAIAKLSPGDTAVITYYRDGSRKTSKVTLRNSQGNTNITKAGSISSLGCDFEKVDSETLKRLELSKGVQVKNLTDGKFRDAGVKEDFIIFAINNTIVSSADDITRIYNSIQKSSDRDKVMFISGMYPSGKQAYYAVNLND